MTLQQDLEVLRNIPLFAKIEPAKLKLLAFTSEHVEFAPEATSFSGRATPVTPPIFCWMAEPTSWSIRRKVR